MTRTLLPLLACCACLATAGTPGPATPQRPNIVFILADDLGWADTTLYGQTRSYRTPNLERLAARGMTFTRAYSASPLCSPTRASILTGLSPARIGITAPDCHLAEEILQATAKPTAAAGEKSTNTRSVTRLETRYRTLAEILKESGYATGHFGKWHLGPEPFSPLQHGFDVDVPHTSGPGPAGSYVAPWKFRNFKEKSPGEHIEDRMAAEAVAFIEGHKSRPFFLNYWMFSVHAPFDAKKDLIEKHRARLDPANPQRSPTYAAMVESMDDAVGVLLDALDRNGLTERTILVFFSDNGGNMYDVVDGGPPTSNAPLRGGKATVYEGGIRVPCIVSWPAHVAPASRSDEIIQSCDFCPTLMEMLGIAPQDGQRFDGISIVPALEGKSLPPRPIFAFFPHDPRVPDWLPPSVAVHLGDWKLIRIFHGGENGAHRWKLFHLTTDPGERDDLAAKEPERVKEMDALIERFLAETKAVVPLRNPRFDPAQYRPELEGVQQKKPAAAKAGPTPPTGKTESFPPNLLGWKPRNSKAEVKDGVLLVRSEGADPFLGFAPGKLAAGARLRFRLRCDGGSGKVEWLPGGKPAVDGKESSSAYAVKAGGWIEIEATLPAQEGESGIIRLHLPAQEAPVEIDWITLTSGQQVRRFDFGADSGPPRKSAPP